MSRKGIIVKNPIRRLTKEQIELVHRTSLELLEETGVLVYSEEAVNLLSGAGASVDPTREGEHAAWWVKIPPAVVQDALDSAPRQVILGAREAENRVVLESGSCKVHFGSGSETNFWLDVEPEAFISLQDSTRKKIIPTITRRRGTVADLSASAHLAENFEHLDFFLRNVNIQDPDIDEINKDVNKFFASLNNTTKHVMGGVTRFDQLKKVVIMAELIAGGREKLQENPVVSFITSVIKSPLQVVEETAQKLFTIARLGLPVVISTSPQGGSTAPVDEAGMVAQVNAEVLVGVTLHQLAAPGAPVIYGAVPVRARMDDLHDMYGVPEFCHYTMCCAQMARHYGIPCYSTAGVADAPVPGMQAAAEKMYTHATVPHAAPDLIHYSFGLLEKTNTFSPEQALLDNHHIGMIKALFREPAVSPEETKRVKKMVNEVMSTPHRLYARYARRLLRSGGIFPSYPFAGEAEDQDETLLKANEKVKEILARPRRHLPFAVVHAIFDRVPGLLPRQKQYND